MIYLTSDTHFHHKNICRGTTEWVGDGEIHGVQRTRDFKTLEEMDEMLISNINAVVNEDDELYHLGDWSFGGIDQIWNFRKRIKCKNIHLIYGNHDQHIEAKKQITIFKDVDWEVFDRLQLTCDQILGNSIYLNTQDLFTSVQYYKKLKANGRLFILSHYAFRVWDSSHKGSIMLYGHSHGTLDALRPEFTSPTWIGDQYFIKNFRTMDVGVDTNQLYPYDINEIIDIMDKKEVLLGVDHHSEKTN